MKTLSNPNQHVRLVRGIRPADPNANAFAGWGPRVPGI